ncbi:NHLP leader peptide family RiPP precursor [Paenibacillus albus]|uniref:NHLP leader peptide family natural product n=1 Tax=Paenibacillus albus TaxID=2495582 RepID=A0A3Q8X717_9BACL|nr:NHLP leader peptide family RiPP precursor [Paenibacillus albus]AZN41669.1 NHLP leader peptide family natural product precursor [Paenibacillus albus]
MSEQELQQQIIEKAWSDESFKAKLLADPKAALQEAFNLTLPEDVELVVVEETPSKLALVIPQNPADAAKTDSELSTW